MATYGDPPPNDGSIYYTTYNTSGQPLYYTTQNAANSTTHVYYPQGYAPGYTQPFPTTPAAPYNWEDHSEDNVPAPPLFADVATVRAALKIQLAVLEEVDGELEGEIGDHLNDAVFYLQETLEALEKIGKKTV